MTAVDLSRTAPKCRSALDLIGNTPVLRIDTPLPGPHRGFWAKLEGFAPGGMKARAALSLVQGARSRGELRPGGAIVESTSGTLGIGLVCVGTALGHPVVIVADRELDGMTRALLRAHGARLEIVSEPHPVGGWQRARRERVAELLAELPGAYWPNQYGNPDNPAGYLGMGRELVNQFEHLDAVVCSVGTGGHSAGIAPVLRERWPGIKIVGVDSPGSTVFGHPAAHRLMRGLGSSIHPRNVAYDVFDEVHWIGPAEAADACRRLAAGAFVTGGWSTGAVALVAAWCAEELGSDEVCGVFPDGPHRYWQTVFDDDYIAEHGLVPEARKPSEVDSSGWTRTRAVTDPCPSRAGAGVDCGVCGEDDR
ncbi:PLP-dependent cysteine synthase family protein [Saccharopolyspora hirsuta]|uniref:PLP-dependent cysteine synthase family protein n=1 Tax=Saccharopolyspora hirsuta TaxID=1837 RepID=A0A5M7BVU8_SACHI|nr:PLP-dependent cysteine synthase family protein [Saccharopolyspora hirsuta]KAA5831334.1 PLP-dependent cysteine synthase family protein [Saccharopolyspora hirsuta]